MYCQDVDQALIDLAVKLKLAQAGQPLIPTATTMKVGNNSCLSADLNTGKIMSYGSAEPKCTDESQQAQRTWVVDALGHIHNGADLTKCINNTNPISLMECDLNADGQIWDVSALPHIKKPNSNQCLDMNGGALWGNGQKTIILYSCGNGQNQKWVNVEIATDNALLPLLHASNLPIALRVQSARLISPSEQ